jgi:uncharacterized protein YceK
MNETGWGLTRVIALLFALQASTGCMGTIETRTNKDNGYSTLKRDHSCFGKWPYEAVWVDINWGNYICHEDSGPVVGPAILAPLFWVSVPLDAVIDTVCLPIDAIAWACGYEKARFDHRGHYDSTGRQKD